MHIACTLFHNNAVSSKLTPWINRLTDWLTISLSECASKRAWVEARAKNEELRSSLRSSTTFTAAALRRRARATTPPPPPPPRATRDAPNFATTSVVALINWTWTSSIAEVNELFTIGSEWIEWCVETARMNERTNERTNGVGLPFLSFLPTSFQRRRSVR